MRAGRDAAEHRVMRIHLQRIGAPGQQAPREAIGQRRLAHPIGAGNQPGMVQPPAAQCIEDGAFGGVGVNATTPDELKRAIGSVCPNVLFPFARAAVAQLVSQGGFPQLLLPPVNFEALYANSQSEAASATRN